MVKQLDREDKWVKVRYRKESGNTAQERTAVRFLNPVKAEPQGNVAISTPIPSLTKPDADSGFFLGLKARRLISVQDRELSIGWLVS